MTLPELKQAIGCAKNGKSGGIDGIPIEFIKYGTGTLHNAILALFNYIFDHGQYPDVWSRGIVNPVYKTGSMCSPENYRKITLISALGKIFDSILNNRMRFCKEALRVDNVWQNGFKPGSHATDNLFIFNAVIDKYTAAIKRRYSCATSTLNRHLILSIGTPCYSNSLQTALLEKCLLFYETFSVKVKAGSNGIPYLENISITFTAYCRGE